MSDLDNQFIELLNTLDNIKDRIKDSEYVDIVKNITDIKDKTSEIICDEDDSDEYVIYDNYDTDYDLLYAILLGFVVVILWGIFITYVYVPLKLYFN